MCHTKRAPRFTISEGPTQPHHGWLCKALAVAHPLDGIHLIGIERPNHFDPFRIERPAQNVMQ